MAGAVAVRILYRCTAAPGRTATSTQSEASAVGNDAETGAAALPHKPANVHEARRSFRAFLATLVGAANVDKVMEAAKTDELPDPYDTLDAYDHEDLERLQGTNNSPGPDERRKMHARLEELRIDEANEKE